LVSGALALGRRIAGPSAVERMRLPASPEAFARATWADLLPYYDDLAAAPLTPDTVERWLAEWSRLEELVGEAGAMAAIAYTCDTENAEKEADHLRFAADIAPKQDEQQVRLARRLLDLGWERRDLETVLRRLRTDARIFREANIALFGELEELETNYDKITGGLLVDWDGERRTIPQLQPFLKSRDRAVRERAFRLIAAPYTAERSRLADLFDGAWERRQQVATNSGFANYRDYAFAAKYRFDYGPDDCLRFHDAVEETVVPAVARLLAYRRSRLGLDVVRPWDLAVDPDRDEPLVPFADIDELIDRGKRVFDSVDPELGGIFREMAAQQLLDLGSRPGKAPGGYCMTLPWRGQPFVFMNATGVPEDVSTLVHEAGHCFHGVLAHRLPFILQRSTGMEAAELASMAMELLASPYLARPTGFYHPEDVRHAWLDHLEDLLASLAHIASVDAFQHSIYTSADGGDRDARDAMWLRIRERFENGVDWSGLRAERVARWYRQSHIFTAPFYYIEYGIAQLGALQIWRDSLADYRAAVGRYKHALALGGTRPLPEIYAAAGAALIFDAPRMRDLVTLVEERIEELRASPQRAFAAV
jgi:oligoendopeptidase F